MTVGWLRLIVIVVAVVSIVLVLLGVLTRQPGYVLLAKRLIKTGLLVGLLYVAYYLLGRLI